jgi:hypothetical protein
VQFTVPLDKSDLQFAQLPSHMAESFRNIVADARACETFVTQVAEEVCVNFVNYNVVYHCEKVAKTLTIKVYYKAKSYRLIETIRFGATRMCLLGLVVVVSCGAVKYGGSVVNTLRGPFLKY